MMSGADIYILDITSIPGITWLRSVCNQISASTEAGGCFLLDGFYLRLLLVTMRWDSVVLKMLWMARAASTCLMAS